MNLNQNKLARTGFHVGGNANADIQPVRVSLFREHIMPAYRPIEERFWEKVNKDGPNGCWLWTGSCGVYDYGSFWLGNGRTIGAHRLAYELCVGPIPEGMFVCHHCDTPACVNPGPGHLFLGTPKDNTQDALKKGRMATGLRQGTHTHPESRVHGTRHGNAKLTDEIVRIIRATVGDVSGVVMARRYGVTSKTISSVRNGKTWQHLLESEQ